MDSFGSPPGDYGPSNADERREKARRELEALARENQKHTIFRYVLLAITLAIVVGGFIAIKNFVQGSMAAGKYSDAVGYFSRCHKTRGKPFAQAEALFNDVIAIQPSMPEPYIFKAVMLIIPEQDKVVEGGRPDTPPLEQADGYLREALSHAPSHPAAIYYQAAIANLRGDCNESIMLLEKAQSNVNTLADRSLGAEWDARITQLLPIMKNTTYAPNPKFDCFPVDRMVPGFNLARPL